MKRVLTGIGVFVVTGVVACGPERPNDSLEPLYEHGDGCEEVLQDGERRLYCPHLADDGSNEAALMAGPNSCSSGGSNFECVSFDGFCDVSCSSCTSGTSSGSGCAGGGDSSGGASPGNGACTPTQRIIAASMCDARCAGITCGGKGTDDVVRCESASVSVCAVQNGQVVPFCAYTHACCNGGDVGNSCF